MAKLTLTDVANLQNESTVVTTLKQNNDATEAALENTLSLDGTSPNQMKSNLDMNNYKVINLPDALTAQEPATYSQLTSGLSAVGNGAVVNASYVTLGTNPTLLSERVLTGGSNISITDGGAGFNVVVDTSDPELNALAGLTSAADKVPYFTGAGTASTSTLSAYGRTLIDDADATTARATLGAVIGTNVQAWDADLDALAGVSSNGMLSRTGAGTASPRIVTGTANEITLTNGDGVSGNPTVSIPAAVTFTGKTVTGGTFSTPTITTPVLNGTPTGTGVATAATVSTLVLRDANGSITGVNLIDGFTTTATAAGTTTLTITSNGIQVFTGATTQTVKLPTTSVVAGQQYIIINQSTGAVTVQSSGANTIVILAGGTSGVFTAVVATPTTAANWNGQYFGVNAASGKVATVNNTITFAGTDSTTITFQGTDTYVGRATIDTLTNKTISGASNTLSSVGLSSLSTQGAFTFVGNNTSGSASPTAVDIHALTLKASPASTDEVIISDQAASGAWKRVAVSSLASAGSVASIAGNTGAFTLANGITNNVNSIELTAARRTLPTTQSLTSGSGATYTTPANCLWIEVFMVGGGGGGGGASTTLTVAGSNGGTSTFNSINAAGGSGSTLAGTCQVGGFGGSGGTGSATRRGRGGSGVGGALPAASGVAPASGNGGNSYFAGGPPGVGTNANGSGNAGDVNSGTGGSGAVNQAGTTYQIGGGGGAGEFVYLLINSPSATYTYTIGAGGAGGVSTQNGGAGGTGYIFVIEHYGS